jgi:hypothetical protein
LTASSANSTASRDCELEGYVIRALPLLGNAMYVPEIRCNGEEIRIEVKDKE